MAVSTSFSVHVCSQLGPPEENPTDCMARTQRFGGVQLSGRAFDLFLSSGGWKSDLRVSPRSGSGDEALPDHGRQATCPHMAGRESTLCGLFL